MRALFISLTLLLVSCSPLKSSPYDEKHQWELTLHEVQTNLDDLRRDIHCFQADLQIIEGRIKYFENAIASSKQDVEKGKLEQLSYQVQALEKKVAQVEKTKAQSGKEMQELSSHANETTVALVQFKQRIQELEQELILQNHRFNDLTKLKESLESLVQETGWKIYKVKQGDTLKKIASRHKITTQRLKEINHLEEDLIVVGQTLKIPSE